MRKSISLNFPENSLFRLANERKTMSMSNIYSAPIYFYGETLSINQIICNNKYSIVLKVKGDTTGNSYILKLLNSPFDDDQRATDFNKEMALHSSLCSDYICKYFGPVIHSIGKGFVLEYCKNGDLYNFLNSNDNRPVVDMLYHSFCLNAVLAVEYLHSRTPPIVHRDIKSPNYLVSGSHRLKLCDFNLSREMTHENINKTLKVWRSTPAWSAPEIVSGDYTVKSDIYSLAIVLWEILSTFYNREYAFPYKGANSDIALMSKIINEPSLRPSFGKITDEWATVIREAWNSDPDKRPDCSQLSHKIENIKVKLENK